MITMTRTMHVTRAMGTMLLAALLVPAAAVAQVRPAPPVPPTPPAPRTVPAPLGLTAPMLAELEKLAELQALDEWRLLSLDGLKLSLEDLKLSGKLLDMDQLRQSAQAAQGTSREAMERAQREIEAARATMQDRALTYTVTTNRSGNDYSAGKDLLGQRQYDQAIARFDKVVAQKAANVDGALYWKAYAQYKLAKSDEALVTIAQLRKDYAQSRYNADAKALEADARKMAGQPVNPASLDDDELKLLAISGIQNTDPERAIPLLEGVLNATNSPRVKKQALYVLALSNQPRAYQILLSYAKGAGNPDLQLEAIRYLAASRSKQTTAADLVQIYQSTQDTDVKMAIIGALRAAGDPYSLLSMASSDSRRIVLRSPGLSGLSGILGPAELWALYEKETNKDLRAQMVSVFGSLQATDQLSRIIKTEKDPDVRRRAVRALGSQKAEQTGQMLMDLYAGDPDVETRKAVIAALGSQENADGLVALARKESSLELKTEIVRRLSPMAPKSKVAADYLMEIIK